MTAAATTSPLISVDTLRARLADPSARTLVCDCRFDLADTAAGERAFAEGHVPGAVYLHLDNDMSAAKTGLNGRHPLPSREAFAAHMAKQGAHNDTLVVALDSTGGMYAARLWWMLGWAGHGAVAVLDGGLQAWTAAGGRLQTGAADARPAGNFTLRPPLQTALDHAAIAQGLGRGRRLVVDARAPDRFRGENETLDPIGGHIPGAANRFFRNNLAADGTFKSAAQLHTDWQALMAGRAASEMVMQCGSGVTACHNLLALTVAGLGGAALYPGSWSEWCAQPGAPVATGA